MPSLALCLEVLGECFCSLNYSFNGFAEELKGEVSAVYSFGRPYCEAEGLSELTPLIALVMTLFI